MFYNIVIATVIKINIKKLKKMSEKTEKRQDENKKNEVLKLSFNNEIIEVELTAQKQEEAINLLNFILNEIVKINSKVNTEDTKLINDIIITSFLITEFRNNKELANKYNFTTKKQINDLTNYIINDLATSSEPKKRLTE